MRFCHTDPHLFPPVISGFSEGVVDTRGIPRSWEMSSSPSYRRLSSASPLCVFFFPPAPAGTPSVVFPKLPRDPGLQEMSKLEVVNMNEVFKKENGQSYQWKVFVLSCSFSCFNHTTVYKGCDRLCLSLACQVLEQCFLACPMWHIPKTSLSDVILWLLAPRTFSFW